PESFSSVRDVSSSLDQYLALFFEVEKELDFTASPQILLSMQKKLKLSDQQLNRIKRFLSDHTGLVFGLRFIDDRFYFLVKKGENQVSYLVAKNTSHYPIKEILSDYLSNVLKTSLTILTESRRREEIRMLSLTDEVTGLFNQRKLVEDLDLYTA